MAMQGPQTVMNGSAVLEIGRIAQARREQIGRQLQELEAKRTEMTAVMATLEEENTLLLSILETIPGHSGTVGIAAPPTPVGMGLGGLGAPFQQASETIWQNAPTMRGGEG